MPATPPLDHEALLTLAHRIEAAARDGEHDRLLSTARRFSQALSDHLDAERPIVACRPPGDRRRLERGQQRVVDLTRELSTTAVAAPSGSDRRCAGLAARLVAELVVQAGDERRQSVAVTEEIPGGAP